jgi:MipA family protein
LIASTGVLAKQRHIVKDARRCAMRTTADVVMTSRFLPATKFALVSFVCAACAHAEPEPLWEAGLGIGALSFPDYRGSDQSRVYPTPVPYFVYRGDFLKSDRDGMRAEFFNHRYVELNVSVNATIPVQSSDDHARQGMPNLRSTFEIGPSVNLHLWQTPDEKTKLDVVLPFRIPITVDTSPQFIGWNFSPRLNLDIQSVAGLSGWNFGVGAGPMFAARKYHEYFYSVAPQYATPERPAFDARGGYSGGQLLAALSKRYPKYWVGAYIRYDTLDGAAFVDSPLVRQKYYLAGGIGFAWMIRQSTRMVETNE